MTTSDPRGLAGTSPPPAPAGVPDLFSADSIAALANEMFAALIGPPSADGGAAAAPRRAVAGDSTDPADTAVPDLFRSAAQDPTTTADISSTSVPGSPSSGPVRNASDGLPATWTTAFPFDSQDVPDGVLEAIRDILPVLSARTPHESVPDDGRGQSGLLTESDLSFATAQATDVPTSFPEAEGYAVGDHPYLQSRLAAFITDASESESETPSATDNPTVGIPGDASTHTDALVDRLLPHLGVAPPEAPAPADPAATDAPQSPGTDPAEHSFAPSLTAAGAEEVPALDIPATTTGFDAARIRQDFPILSERVHGRELVWLDNGATTQKPRQVIDRLSYFYEHENSNVHRTAHTLAGRATDAYEGARDKVRDFINAPTSDEVVWVRGTTEGINLIANTFGDQRVGEGDEVLISWLEHHANIVPWQMLCARKGARLVVAPVDDTGQVILSEFERLITPRTKVAAFTQVSNALGTITPAAEMTAIAHRHGVPVVVDGAQGVLHMPVDVQEIDCDFYVFSGHKMFAPTGIGVVFGKADHLAKMPPWQGGGNMIDHVYFDHTTYQPPPWRFEAGTGSIADAVGLGAAIDYVTDIGMDNVARYEHTLLEYGTDLLCAVPGLTLYGTARQKAGVLSFNIEGHDPVEVGKYLDQCGIAVRAGHHCAQPILRRFGVAATVRAALALYNTEADLDRLAAALHRLVAGTPPEA